MLNVAAPVTIKNILVATDFSPLWEIALPFVSAVARRHQANLTFLHVIPTIDVSGDPARSLSPRGRETSGKKCWLNSARSAKDLQIPDAKKSTMVVHRRYGAGSA